MIGALTQMQSRLVLPMLSTDMARMMRVYGEGGFDGPMRPDHAPTLEGEPNDKPGYAFNGKIFAFGYMKGLMDALGIPAA